jgi:hypothetical protein
MLHHLLVILEWILGLSSITIAALIAIAWLIATIRVVIVGRAPAWTPGDVPAAILRASNEGYPHRVLVAFDIFLNVVFCFGEQDETMSTHAWRKSSTWFGKAVNYWLSWFQPNHGPQAASGDLERATARIAILSKALGVNNG